MPRKTQAILIAEQQKLIEGLRTEIEALKTRVVLLEARPFVQFFPAPAPMPVYPMTPNYPLPCTISVTAGPDFSHFASPKPLRRAESGRVSCGEVK